MGKEHGGCPGYRGCQRARSVGHRRPCQDQVQRRRSRTSTPRNSPQSLYPLLALQVACQVEHLSANQHHPRGVSGTSTLVYRTPDETPRLSPQELSVSDLKLTAASRIHKSPQSLGLSTPDFRVYQLIGSGAQGAVLLVQHLKNGRFYALKVIKKSVLKQSHFPFVFQEQVILKSVAGSPWFAHLRASFEDNKNFYLLTVRVPRPAKSSYR